MAARFSLRSSCASLTLTLGLTPSALAQQSTDKVHLSLVRDSAASEACAGASAIQADVRERLGFSPFVAAEPDAAAIEVSVARGEGIWSASITMRDPDGSLRGRRRVDSRAPDCQSLASATGLAIALMIDPQLLLREPDEPPAASALPPSAPAHPPAREASAPGEPSQRVIANVALRAGVSFAAGLLPKPASGPVLEGEIGISSHWGIGLGARFFPETRWPRAGADISSSLVLGSIGPCHRVELGGELALSSCGSLLAGSLALIVSSPEPVDPGARAWLGAGLGLRLAKELGPLEVGLALEGIVHVQRRQYEVQREGPTRREVLHRESPVAGVGTLTLGVRL